MNLLALQAGIYQLKEGRRLSFGFDSFINSPVMRRGPELSSIKAEVNFVNASFIISTVSFLRASKLNGTSITCDEETIMIISPPKRIIHLQYY